MVKDGSDGLYNLPIEKIEPHISEGGVDIVPLKIVPDSATVLKLKSSAAATIILKITIDSFHIDGPGIEDILHKNVVDLKTISPGKVKRRKLLSFVGNVLLIKNSNPSKGKAPREETFASERNDHQPFLALPGKQFILVF